MASLTVKIELRMSLVYRFLLEPMYYALELLGADFSQEQVDNLIVNHARYRVDGGRWQRLGHV